MVAVQSLVFFPGTSRADMETGDSTMLMFVGEDLSLVTLASRIPESAGSAPALARVVDSQEIEMRGFETLAELLAFEPGIYIAGRASGSVAYMRGVRDGLLFLYDGVPISTNATRSTGQLDKEISLHNISRVEIIRGPGSVLWGADAFAGIVNLVPFKGSEKKGFTTELSAGGYGARASKVSWGGTKNDWDLHFSGYYGEDRYHKDAYLVETAVSPSGQPAASPSLNSVDDSRYSEFTGTASKGDWLDLSWRLADSTRNYVVNNTEDLSWKGAKETPSGFIKASVSKKAGKTDVTFSGYYQYIKELTENVDLEREVSDKGFYTEMLLHRPVALYDHLTAGVSFRSSSIKGAVLDDSYLPQFLKPSNKIFVPTAEQKDFSNDLISVFAQYRHKWGRADTWIGARYDDHKGYKSTASYSLGINLPVAPLWRVKMVGGTAYRTPYANNLIQDGAFDPESITTLNLEAIWDNTRGSSISFALFGNWLENYIYEDPYGGLSRPTDQRVMGVELAGETRIARTLRLYAAFTALDTTGESMPYKVPYYTYISPDGTSTTVYDEWDSKYDAGPKFVVSGGFFWEPCKRFFLSANVGLTDKVPFAFEQNSKTGSFHADPMVSAEAGIKDIFVKNSRLTLGCKNLFSTSNKVQGMYGPVETTPAVVYLKLNFTY